ncbi:MAG: hypothetical protein ACU0CI_03505 [Shimia sp.]
MNKLTWAAPTEADEGTERLVSAEELRDEDFNPEGVCIGVIYAEPEAHCYSAIVARWHDAQDCWISKEIRQPFLVAHPPW